MMRWIHPSHWLRWKWYQPSRRRISSGTVVLSRKTPFDRPDILIAFMDELF